MTTPPPPPGFVIADDPIPPPPPGFVIGDAQPGKLQQLASYVGSGRALDDIKAAYRGDAAEQAPSAGTPGLGEGPVEAARDLGAQVFGDDFDMAKRIARTQPGASVTQDANGNAMVQFPDGRRVYANQPGLDSGDFLRAGGMIASFAPGVSAARGLAGGSLAARAALTGATGTATDLGGQALGRDEVDLTRAALVGGLGVAGEVVVPAIAGIVSKARSLFRSGASKEQAAVNIARDMGINQPTTRQVQTLAKGLDEIEAGANPNAILGSDEFGFLYTRGQKLPEGAQKFSALSAEEKLRQSTGAAGAIMRDTELKNRQALESGLSRIGGELGGTPIGTPAGGIERAQGIVQEQANSLRQQISDAYKLASEKKAAVSTDAVRALPDRLAKSVASYNLKVTPATKATLESISEDIAKLPPEVSGVTLRAIENQRQVINNSIGAAANRADRAALTAIKREYDQWLDDAFDRALVSGEPDALAAMKQARGLRAEFGKRFEGGADTDRFVTAMIDGDKTAEELLNMALGAAQVSKAASGRFIQRVAAATDNSPEALNALRAAHFMKLTTNKAGDPLGFQAVMQNIKATEQSNSSLIRALYTDAQWGQIKRLAQAIDPLVPKGDFARTSGTAERFARFFGSTPWLGKGLAAAQEPFKAVAATGVTGPLRAQLPATPAPVLSGIESLGKFYTGDGN